MSSGFLLVLGAVNLRCALSAEPSGVVALVGLKGPWIARLMPARGLIGAAVVGALFALSFDTVSQSVLF